MIFGRKKTIDLCGECAATLKGDFEIKELPKPRTTKSPATSADADGTAEAMRFPRRR